MRDKELPTRKHIRLKNYDYSQNGAYFITVCTKNKMCIFWDNNDKYQPLSPKSTLQTVVAAFRRPENPHKIRLSEYGQLVKNELDKIPIVYPDIVFISKYVIMPNHVHLIIIISNDVNGGRRNAAPTISRIMNQFKGCVSRKSGFPVWQKSFYDRIIRNANEYRAFCDYIISNPSTWGNDELFSK